MVAVINKGTVGLGIQGDGTDKIEGVAQITLRTDEGAYIHKVSTGQWAIIADTNKHIATRFSGVEDEAGQNRTRSLANAGEISTLTSGLGTANTNISTNTANITTNTTNIATNTANISSNDSDISANETAIEKVGITAVMFKVAGPVGAEGDWAISISNSSIHYSGGFQVKATVSGSVVLDWTSVSQSYSVPVSFSISGSAASNMDRSSNFLNGEERVFLELRENSSDTNVIRGEAPVLYKFQDGWSSISSTGSVDGFREYPVRGHSQEYYICMQRTGLGLHCKIVIRAALTSTSQTFVTDTNNPTAGNTGNITEVGVRAYIAPPSGLSLIHI